jgi:DNA repair photolyase
MTPQVDSEVVKEASRWLQDNKTMCLGKGTYDSPRISSEIADCSMPMTFDHLSLCSMGCTYCFSRTQKENIPSHDKNKSLQLIAVDPAKKLLDMQGKYTTKKGELFYKHFYSKKFLLHWGGLADPFCGFEKKNNVGLKFIEGLGEMNYPTLFSFKGGTIFDKEYQTVFERYAKQKNFAFQCSIITNSDELSSQVEIGVPNTTKRLEAIKMLSQMGYWTILRLRPFIIGISDQELDTLLNRALAAGIKGISMEFFAFDSRAGLGGRKRFEWLGKLMGTKDIIAYYKALSPSERGGYMRLNRLVKEQYVRQIYEFCTKHGLVCGISDPDFKELNGSGSCCGMPDLYPDNPLLTNWTRSQLTYHLKEARKLYHLTGDRKELKFNDVYGAESYLDETGFANEHICTVNQPRAKRNNLTQRIILQKQWNNTNSPSNPMNYFHGKLIPVGIDGQGNLIFRYNPVEYEQQWVNEGVDLTK